MRVKSFQGGTLEEILPQIRAEMGPDAVVLSQRQLINGGIGGFFGKRVIEVVAADRMPSDEQLVELEEQGYRTRDDEDVEIEVEAPMPPPRRAITGGSSSKLDLVDDWDPADDDAIAADDALQHLLNKASHRAGGETVEPPAAAAPALTQAADMRLQTTPYGRSAPAAEPAAAQASAPQGYEPLDVPQLPRATASIPQYVTEPPVMASPQSQAQELAARAHQAIAEATREIEDQLAFHRGRRTESAATRREPLRTHADTVPQLVDDLRVAMTESTAGAGYLISPAAPGARAPQAPAAPSGPPRSVIEAARQMEAELVDIGVEAEVAQAMVHTVVAHRMPFSATADMRTLTRELLIERIPVETGWPSVGRVHRMAVVGPSGVGKSSVVAKLADGYSQLAGYRVGIVSIVAPGESAHELDRAGDTLGRAEHLDVRYVANHDQMLRTLERMTDVDIVLIDTPGGTYHDAQSYTNVATCLRAARVDDVHVVIPLATSWREAESLVDHYRGMGVNRLVVSKVDESRYVGQLVNFGFRHSLPITFLADGPRVPEDIRAASATEIANLIVPHKE